MDGMYLFLKEKLQALKKGLKVWIAKIFRDLMRKQAQVEKGISELEKKEDEGDLDEEANRKKKLQEFWRVVTCNESLLRQNG